MGPMAMIPFFMKGEQYRRDMERDDTSGANWWDIVGKVADPLGLVGGETAWGKKGFLGTGFDLHKMAGGGGGERMDPGRWQDRIDPALMKQLMAQARGEGDSAAETLGREMVERNQRGMLSASISGESAGGGMAVRQGLQAGERHALDMGAQIMAMRQQEQARAQQLLVQAMMQGSSLDDALAMFRAEMAMHRENRRSQMLAQGMGAALQAYTSYMQSQQGSGPGYDVDAANAGAYGDTVGPYGGGTYNAHPDAWDNSAPTRGEFPAMTENQALGFDYGTA